ncbi:MAG: TSUP family transporter [Hominenteromicrobium sp.]|uniref:TSUP family transporter n=1 Tax=Hominenteromicrobium sp. TaxID=3073581 RepID=UPI0039A185EA
MPSGWASACTTASFGPGTGTFAIIAFTTLMGFDLRTAGGNAKVLNLASNYASLVTYLSSGLVVFSIGIPCAISGIVGNLLGSHFALQQGRKVHPPHDAGGAGAPAGQAHFGCGVVKQEV